MRRKHQDSVEWLEFYSLSKFSEIVHGVFTRRGGDSLPPYDSLNFSLSVGDDSTRVLSNRKKVQDILGVSKMIMAEQVHGSEVALVTQETTQEEISKCDSLITRYPDIALCIKHADCQAALFFDPTKKTIAAAHSGWRGSVQNIYARTIDTMQKLGSRASDIIVCISPSLGPNASKLEGIDTDLPDYFYYFQKPTGEFDFWAISYKQLIDKGIRPQNIEIARIDTVDNKEDFFSYRREKITGRNVTAIALRKPIIP